MRGITDKGMGLRVENADSFVLDVSLLLGSHGHRHFHGSWVVGKKREWERQGMGI